MTSVLFRYGPKKKLVAASSLLVRLVPDATCIRIIVHDSCTVQEHGLIIRPLIVVNLAAVEIQVGAIKDSIPLIDEPDGSGPVPDFLGPIHVGLIASHAGKASCHLKEATI